MPSGYGISPSDLVWTYSECPRCYYLAVRHKLRRPARPMAAIFQRIDDAAKRLCRGGTRTEAVCSSMPPGTFVSYPEHVYSRVYPPPPGAISRFYVHGKPDGLVQWDDGTFAIIDHKTSSPSPSSVLRYGTQLEIYATALEDPAEGEPIGAVSSLGLIVFEPQAFKDDPEEGKINLHGNLVWLPVGRQHEQLRALLAEVIPVLDGLLPPPTMGCPYCAWPDAPAAVGRQGTLL